MRTQCEICGSENDAELYTDWECVSCGQNYKYDEGHAIVLTEDQRALLQLANSPLVFKSYTKTPGDNE